MLEFGFDAAHPGGEAPFAVVAPGVAAFGGLADGESLISDAVGFRAEFQPFPLPPAFAGAPRLIGAPAGRRPPGSLVVGAKVAVTLLAIVRLRRLRRLRRSDVVMLGYPVIGGITVAGIVNAHPHTVSAASVTNCRQSTRLPVTDTNTLGTQSRA